MRVLYIDCFSGISGDMMVGALLDAGASYEKLVTELKKLDVDGYQLAREKVVKEGIAATKFHVHLEHVEDHHHDHHHHHRHYQNIVSLIDNSSLEEGVKRRSKEIFALIAKAEAKIHHIPVEKVHYHEVGAVDSIIDIIGTAILLEDLQIDIVYSTPVPLGSGSIRISHGIYPVPAPATLEILKNIPLAPSDLTFEMTTPTGAAIIASQATKFGAIPAMKVETIGYGAGTKDIPKRPNVLRVVIGELLEKQQTPSLFPVETITVLECQIDDMTGEHFGYVLERLFAEGALDVYYTPIMMKKNRPGTLITVLSPTDRADDLTNILLIETTTLGVRKSQWERTKFERTTKVAETPYGKIRIKQALHQGKVVKETPEYEDIRKIAKEQSLPFRDIYYEVIAHLTRDQ